MPNTSLQSRKPYRSYHLRLVAFLSSVVFSRVGESGDGDLDPEVSLEERARLEFFFGEVGRVDDL